MVYYCFKHIILSTSTKLKHVFLEKIQECEWRKELEDQQGHADLKSIALLRMSRPCLGHHLHVERVVMFQPSGRVVASWQVVFSQFSKYEWKNIKSCHCHCHTWLLGIAPLWDPISIVGQIPISVLVKPAVFVWPLNRNLTNGLRNLEIWPSFLWPRTTYPLVISYIAMVKPWP